MLALSDGVAFLRWSNSSSDPVEPVGVAIFDARLPRGKGRSTCRARDSHTQLVRFSALSLHH